MNAAEGGDSERDGERSVRPVSRTGKGKEWKLSKGARRSEGEEGKEVRVAGENLEGRVEAFTGKKGRGNS